MEGVAAVPKSVTVGGKSVEKGAKGKEKDMAPDSHWGEKTREKSVFCHLLQLDCLKELGEKRTAPILPEKKKE